MCEQLLLLPAVLADAQLIDLRRSDACAGVCVQVATFDLLQRLPALDGPPVSIASPAAPTQAETSTAQQILSTAQRR